LDSKIKGRWKKVKYTMRWKGRDIAEEVASNLVGSEAAIADFDYNHPDAAGPESTSVAPDDWIPNVAFSRACIPT
jgi:hypothetical protein